MGDEERIREFIITGAANVMKLRGRIYYVSIYLVIWLVVLACNYVTFRNLNAITEVSLLAMILACFLGGTSLLCMIITLGCFNRRDQRYFLYVFLLTFSICISVATSIFALFYDYLGAWLAVLYGAYILITVMVMWITGKATERRILRGMLKESSIVGSVGIGIGGCGVFGMLLAHVLPKPVTITIIFVMTVGIQVVGVPFLTAYWYARKCDIPKEMLFNEKYATVKDPEDDEEEDRD